MGRGVGVEQSLYLSSAGYVFALRCVVDWARWLVVSRTHARVGQRQAETDWRVVDCGSIVVHLMTAQVRQLLWQCLRATVRLCSALTRPYPPHLPSVPRLLAEA